MVLVDAAAATSPAGAGGTVVHEAGDAGCVTMVGAVVVVELLGVVEPEPEEEEPPQPQTRIVETKLNARRCAPHGF